MNGETTLEDKKKQEKKTPFEAKIFNILTIMLFFIIGLQVFFRWVLNRSLSWSEEFSRYFFIWSSYLAVSVAAYHGRHIRITAHILLLPKKIQRIVLTAADIIWIGFNILVVVNSILFNISMFHYPFYSETLGFNLVWVYMIIPFAYSLLTLRIIKNIIDRFRTDMEIADARKEL